MRNSRGPRRRSGAGRLTRMLLATLLTVACADRTRDVEAGVSWSLALERSSRLTNIRYELEFRIPESVKEPILGQETIRFTLSNASDPLVLDFDAPGATVRRIAAGGRPVEPDLTAGHVIVPASALDPGENTLEIEFVAGDMSLNRNPGFLYTLFVPARASTAFPNFDQPNLKATYQLTLITPPSWRAVANGALVSSDSSAEAVTHRFGETKPLSTYLFAFAAGEFAVERAMRDGRPMTMYHRETDTATVRRNRDAIFDLHATALAWLENYTGIPYPFDKFDFVLIPAFQYGGMEHPGSILYRASSLMLDASATQNQLLGRASLIAHETAHMWFGNFVTMNWFDDVWTKEVFANFMAAKIVNPSFPEIDHELRFFLGHYPSAYDVDRTAGANPIRQELTNLNDAGSLYGAIIYQKAPIMMRHLERITGEQAFRDGMGTYLKSFAYSNATWPDLVGILDEATPENLRQWSETWVEQPNRPTITAELEATPESTIGSLVVRQSDPGGRDRVWSQQLRVLLGWRDSSWVTTAQLSGESVEIADAVGLPLPDYTLPAADGVGYGYFQLDEPSRTFLLHHVPSLDTPLDRSAAWVTLWDAMLEGLVDPERLIQTIVQAIPLESNELNTQRILGYLTTAYWRYLPTSRRTALAPNIEQTLWAAVERAGSTSQKAAYFNALVSITLTTPGTDRLARVWRKSLTMRGLPLAERDFISIAEALAVRGVPDGPEILDEQMRRIRNADRKAQFAFVLPSLSTSATVRDSFFESLRDAANREHEPWVLRAVRLLHHPLRAHQSERYIRPSLELLEEIQRTGDIFFPKRWLDATLGGHNSVAAAVAVRTFLDERPGYPPPLRLKILQSADPVFRAVRIVN